MVSPRWRKALQDLWINKTRTVLVILAIAIGIFGIGSILTSYSILLREINVNYENTNPASAIFTVENLDTEAVDLVQSQYPEVSDIEMRRTIRGRVEVAEDEWLTLMLFVIDDFNDVRVNTFTPEEGAYFPATGDLLIERVALPVMDMEIGDTAQVRTPHGEEQTLQIIGTLHDPGLAPAWMEGLAYGYITPATAVELGETDTFNELRVVVTDKATGEASTDRSAIEETSLAMKQDLMAAGYTVTHVEVPHPGEHPHNDQLKTLLFLLEAFGVLAFVLSGMLVINLITALLARQIRQIGMMKAIGGRTRQVMGIYLSMVLILGLLALVIAIPISVLIGEAYAAFAADMLNFEITDASIPAWVFGVQIGIALLMPTLTALYPIYRNSRVSVQTALNDYGVTANSFGSNIVGRLLSRVQGLGRTVLLSLRNTFRQQGRLALTLSTLSIGGAVFMVALNVGASWNKTLDVGFGAQDYDIMLFLDNDYSTNEIADVLADVPDIESIEYWGQTNAAVTYDDGTQSGKFMFLAPPADTDMLNLPVIEGRWLEPTDTNAVVINHGLLDHEPDLAVGEEITLNIQGQESQWEIVGLVREIGMPGIAYTNYASYVTLMDTPNQANHVRLIGSDRSKEGQAELLQTIEQRFDRSSLKLTSARTTATNKQVLLDHVLIIVTFLLFMAILVAAVGGLGLMSTMSLNVLERMREIGVMRAIGASAIKILQIFMVEGVFVGLLSWLIAIPLSIPLTGLVGNVSSSIFIQSPMEIAYSFWGVGIWFGLVVVLAGFASAFPALKATELPAHQVLAYE